ncbi:MAG: transporter substrate-binding domain-containing protein, partial [Caldilinea sp.]
MRQLLTRPAWGLVLCTVILAALVMAACRPVAQTPSTPAPLDSAAEWQRILDDGRIVVGTSADYPPFEFYNDNFQIDGFDPALIREIAEQLGVEVQFQDMAFDGLGEALVIGQVDVVIAAVSQTPERARLVDFTDTYFVSSDGYLANKSSALRVESLEDLKDLRVGVQRGSI